MSTRGTYKIYDDYNDMDVYFYIQCDNYPAGAAERFKIMLPMVDKNPYGSEHGCSFGYASAFFRMNEDARFTKSHECHEDTNYQYDIVKAEDDSMKLIVRQSEYQETIQEYEWKPFYEGTLEDFIQQYSTED